MTSRKIEMALSVVSILLMGAAFYLDNMKAMLFFGILAIWMQPNDIDPKQGNDQ